MKKLILASALVAALGTAGVASAGPLDPSLASMANPLTTPDETMIAGEGAAPNFKIGAIVEGVAVGIKAVQHMDWIVRRDTAADALGGYVYYYQVENNSIFALSNALIASGLFTSIAVAAGLDLDVDADAASVGAKGHNSVNFLNLAGVPAHDFTLPVNEEETETTGVGGALVCCTGPDGAALISGSINAIFLAGLKVGDESGIIIATGTRPIYGDFLNSGTVGKTNVAWESNNTNPLGGETGMEIAVPGDPLVVPEPGTILLLGAGLLGFGFWSRRRLQK